VQLNLNPALVATVFHCVLLVLLQGNSCQQQQDRPSGSSQRAATTATATPVEGKENDREDATVKHNNGSSHADNRRAKGMWGGNHVRLDVSEAEAQIEFDCAHGTLGRIEPDANGNFDVTGTYVAERGPIRVDETRAGRPARYHGRVNDKTLTLTVTLTDTGDEVGTFTLTQGKGTRLTKCL